MASLYASTEQIRREAAQLDPVKVAITLLLLPPFVLFFAARYLWMVPALLWSGGMHGWRIADKQIKAREFAARGG